MKKTVFALLPLLILSLAVSCQREESGFSMEGDPHFSIVVRDAGDIVSASLEEMTAGYTLYMGASGYSSTANASNHVSKAHMFHVQSNMRWKIVPSSGTPESWIYPFPQAGEKDGIFFFKTSRNTDPQSSRVAYFNVLVDDGSGNWEPLEGMLKAVQYNSDEFLEMSAAKFGVEAAGQTVRLRVFSNVDWDYSLSPMADYATEDLSWIEDASAHESTKQIDTLKLIVAPNGGSIRGANLTVNYKINGTERSEVVPITQYPASEASLEGFPVKWVVGVAESVNYSGTFPSSGTINPVEGAGLITFNNDCGKAADTKAAVKLDVSGNCPRAAGVWPGDYCEFMANAPVAGGSIVKLVFGTRVSATGQKYWRLEYRDGEEWKVAGATKTNEEVKGPDGKPVVYTHEMYSDGATNLLVESAVIYQNTTDRVEFRFICAANYKADGSGTLAAPNTGTWRLAVNDPVESDPYQPQISIIAGGTDVIVPAKLSVSPSYLVFEGKPGTAKKTFNVSCNQSFTIEPSASWIHPSAASSDGGENLAFTVTCDNNGTIRTREAKIVIKSGVSREEIAIIQGAGESESSGAQGELDPLISIVGGNALQVNPSGGSSVVSVQSNVAVSTRTDADWLTVTSAPSTKALVGVGKFSVNYSANTGTESRVAHVVFYSGNLESVLTVTQPAGSGGEDQGAFFPVTWSFPEPSDTWAEGTDYAVTDLKEGGAWVYSDFHGGKLSVNRDEKTVAAKNATTYKRESATFDSKVWIKQDAMQKGCYWLFEVYDVKNPAGEYTLGFRTCASASGPKYFLVEYSTDGGASWTAVNTTSDHYYYNDDPAQAGFDITWSYWLHSSNALEDIVQRFTIDRNVTGTLMIKATVAEDYRASKNGKIDTAGTNRIGDYITIDFKAKQ